AEGQRRRAFEPRFDERREERGARRPERRGPGGGPRGLRKGGPAAGEISRDSPPAPTAPSGYEGERVATAIARARLGSRRDAEIWIEAGRVAVNGEVLTSAARNVTARDRITVDGNPLPTRERTRLWLYHKPRGLVTTEKDPEGRPTVFERLPPD